MRRPAFTLIELLVVIGILIGIVSVTMLSLTGFRHKSELRAIADRLESVCELARAEALRGGHPVELLVRESASDSAGAAGDRPGSASLRVMTRTLDPAQTAGRDDAGLRPEPPAPRTRTELPKWFVLDRAEDNPSPARSEAADTRLAVFLPDGSALAAAAEGVLFRDTRAGARLHLSIDALTGACLSRIDWTPPDSAEEPPEPSEDAA